MNDCHPIYILKLTIKPFHAMFKIIGMRRLFMSTKSEVLKALMEETEGISGERLARRLKISRNSVWKAIVQLGRWL